MKRFGPKGGRADLAGVESLFVTESPQFKSQSLEYALDAISRCLNLFGLATAQPRPAGTNVQRDLAQRILKLVLGRIRRLLECLL